MSWKHPNAVRAKVVAGIKGETEAGLDGSSGANTAAQAAAAQAAASIACSSSFAATPFSELPAHPERIMSPTSPVLATDSTSVPEASEVSTMCASWASVHECLVGLGSGRLFSVQLSEEVGTHAPEHVEFESSTFVGSLLSSFLGVSESGVDPVLAVSVVGTQQPRFVLAVHVSGTVRLWNLQSQVLARESHLQRLVATSSVDGLRWVEGLALREAQLWGVDTGAAGSAVLQWSAQAGVWTPPVRISVLAGASGGAASLSMVALSSEAPVRGSFSQLIAGPDAQHNTMLLDAVSNAAPGNDSLLQALGCSQPVLSQRLAGVQFIRSHAGQPSAFALLWDRQEAQPNGATLLFTGDDALAQVWLDASVDVLTGQSSPALAYEDGAALAQAASSATAAAQSIARRLSESVGGELYHEASRSIRGVPTLGSCVGFPVDSSSSASAVVLPPSVATAPAEYEGGSSVPAAAELRQAISSSPAFAAAHAVLRSAVLPSLPYEPAVQVPWAVSLPRQWRAGAITACKSQMVAAADTIDLVMLQQLRLSLPLAVGKQGVLSLLAPKPTSAARFSPLQLLTAATAVSSAFQLAPFKVVLELPENLAAAAQLGGSRKAVLQACQAVAESSQTSGIDESEEDWAGVEVQLDRILLASAPARAPTEGGELPELPPPCPWAAVHPLTKRIIFSVYAGDVARMLLSAVHGATAALYGPCYEANLQEYGDDSLQRAAAALVTARAQAWGCTMQALHAAQACHTSPWGVASDMRNLHLVGPLNTLTKIPAPDAAADTPAADSTVCMLQCVSPGVARALQAQCLLPQQLTSAVSQAAQRWEPHVLQCVASMPDWIPDDASDAASGVFSASPSDAAFAMGVVLALAANATASNADPQDMYVALAARNSEAMGMGSTAEQHPLLFAALHPHLAVEAAFSMEARFAPATLPEGADTWSACTGPAVPPLWLATVSCCTNARLVLAHVAANALECMQPVEDAQDLLLQLLRQVKQASVLGIMGWAQEHTAIAQVSSRHDLSSEFAVAVPDSNTAAEDSDAEQDVQLEASVACTVLGLPSTSVDVTVGSNLPSAVASSYAQWVHGELAMAVDAAAEGEPMPSASEEVQPISMDAAATLAQLLQQSVGSAITSCLAAALAASARTGSSWMAGAPVGRSALGTDELLLIAASDESTVSLQPLYAALCVDEATSEQQRRAVASIVSQNAGTLSEYSALPQHGLVLAASMPAAGQGHAAQPLADLYGIHDDEPVLPLQQTAGLVAPLAILLQLEQQAVVFHTPLDIAGCVQDSDALVAMLGHATAATGSSSTALLRSSSLAYATAGAGPAGEAAGLPRGGGQNADNASGMNALQSQAWCTAQPSLLCGLGAHAGASIMDAWGIVHSRLNVARHPVGLQLMPLANGAGNDVAPLASGQSIFMPIVEGQQYGPGGSSLQRHIVVQPHGGLSVRAADRFVSTPRSPADCIVVGDVELLTLASPDEPSQPKRQSLWNCGCNEAHAVWGHDGEAIFLDCTRDDVLLAGLRAELWNSNVASASQQLRRGDRMWLPKTVAAKPKPKAWESVSRMARGTLPGTAVLSEGTSILQSMLLTTQVGISAAAGALLACAEPDSSMTRRVQESAEYGIYTSGGLENALLGSMPMVHKSRVAVCAQPTAPANLHAQLAAAVGILAPPLHGSSVHAVHSPPQHTFEAESAPSPSLEASPLPSAPLGAYASLVPALHIAACLRQYHAVWSLGAAMAQPEVNAAPAFGVVDRLERALSGEQGRQHAFASAACSTAVLDSLATAGACEAATALVHTFSAQLLHACLPSALSNDDAQAAVLLAQAEPEENDGVLAVLQNTKGFAGLKEALGSMYHPPDDLHDVPETILALTVGAGVSETATRRSKLEGPASKEDTDMTAQSMLGKWRDLVASLRSTGGIAARSMAPSRSLSAARSMSMGPPTDADQRLSQLVAYGWRLRAAHLYSVSQLLQTMARPFAVMAEEQSKELDDFRLYTLSASDRLQPLSAALVCMRCVCNEKARARRRGFFLRDVQSDYGQAAQATASGLELAALPAAAREDADGDFVPPPPSSNTNLSLMRSQSVAEAQATEEASQQDKLVKLTSKLTEDFGVTGRLTANDAKSVVDDDVSLLVSISSRQVDLALDAQEFKLAVAAAAAQPMPDAASHTLQTLAARLLENFRVQEFVALDAAPRIWGVILENIAWQARTSPVPLSMGGAHYEAQQNSAHALAGVRTVDFVPSERSVYAAGQRTSQVLSGAQQVDINAYTVLASVATSQQRWADAAGWYYALAYRQAAAAASVVLDLQGVSDTTLQGALHELASDLGHEASAPSSRSRGSGDVKRAAGAFSVVIALLNCRSTALDAAVACLACLPADEAFLTTVDTEDRLDRVATGTTHRSAHAMQAILAQDVQAEADLARGQTLLLQVAITAECKAIHNEEEQKLAALRANGVLELFSKHVLSPEVHWGAVGQLPAARSALVSAVCISCRLWLACATRQRGVLWPVEEGGVPNEFMHLDQGDAAGHGAALVLESMRMASAGCSSVPSQSAPGSPGVIGLPMAPIQLALCEVGAYDLAAAMADAAAQHRQAVTTAALPIPVGQRAQPVYIPLSEVVRHAARRAVDHTSKPPQLPGAPVMQTQADCSVASLLRSLVLSYDGPHQKWAGALAVVDETLLASDGQQDAPEWAVDLATWGVSPPPSSFQSQLDGASASAPLQCGNPLALLQVLWTHGQVRLAAAVAVSCLPAPHSASCPPVALLSSLQLSGEGASSMSPAELVTLSNKHAPVALPEAAFRAVQFAAADSSVGQELASRLEFYKTHVMPSQSRIMQAAQASAQREADAQMAAVRRSRRAGVASQAARQRAEARDTVRAAADGQVLDAAMAASAATANQAGGEQWQEMVQQLHGPFVPVSDPVAAAIAAALQDDTEQDADLGA